MLLNWEQRGDTLLLKLGDGLGRHVGVLAELPIKFRFRDVSTAALLASRISLQIFFFALIVVT